MNLERSRLVGILRLKRTSRKQAATTGNDTQRPDEASELFGNLIGNNVLAIPFRSTAGKNLETLRLLRRDGEPWGSNKGSSDEQPVTSALPESERTVVHVITVPQPGVRLEPFGDLFVVPLPEQTNR